MRVVDDAGSGEWLRERLHGWGTVGSTVGHGFEAYARVLHPMNGRQLDWTDHGSGMVPRVAQERAFSWAEVAAARGATMHPLVQFSRLAGDPADLELPGGWGLEEPHMGMLDAQLWVALATHLAAATATPAAVTLGIWEGHGTLHPGSSMVMVAIEGGTPWQRRKAQREVQAAHDREVRASISSDVARVLADGLLLDLPGRAYLLLEGSLAELADPDWGYDVGIGWREPWGRDPQPQLAWPADHAWVVASEIDFDSTLVAGPRALIDAVLADPTFEAFEVDADGDLSIEGDTLNPAR